MQRSPNSLEQAAFTNSFVDALPGDPVLTNTRRQVPGFAYSRVSPTKVADPHLLAWSDRLGETLGLSRPPVRGAAVDILGGNAVAESMKPFAARYGGHQFGAWAGQLGDGRAIGLGELTAPDGQRWEIQLKGAGPTPYSRTADGRAVLRSSLREFLCSEAMFHLGVPTTRALSLVGTGDTVIRDMFYSGDPKAEKGAVVARVAPTFVRFGNFEIFLALDEVDNLRMLADYVLREFYPQLGPPSEEAYIAMFEEVCHRTGVMIANWMAYGFVHGVMNTDNMSILGLTIDYGPYGWIEPYDPQWTPNTTDFSYRRYTFAQQPAVGAWNLTRLAQALYLLAPEKDRYNDGMTRYWSALADTYASMLQRKLGLSDATEEDQPLLDGIHECLVTSEVDMTLFFRGLSNLVPTLLDKGQALDTAIARLIHDVSYADPESVDHSVLGVWLHRYTARLQAGGRSITELQQEMFAANPKYVLRNYLAQQAIEAADEDDLAPLERLLTVLEHPFDEQPEHDELARKRPEWAKTKPGCATLSCSS